MNEVGAFVSTVGFPIAIACGLIYIVYKALMIVINKVITVFDVITETNKELTVTNSLLVIELKGQISNIDKKVDKVLENTEVI